MSPYKGLSEGEKPPQATSTVDPQKRQHFTIDINALPVTGPSIDPARLNPSNEPLKGSKARPNPRSNNEHDPTQGASQVAVNPNLQNITPPLTQGSSSHNHTSMTEALGAPRRSSSPFSGRASPRRLAASSSPRHLSPATSQIFERDVLQESAMGSELSPAIPHHVQIEDHIPPVLEASSLAITDTRLNPDEVEIVTHAAHQPASFNFIGSGGGSVEAVSPSYVFQESGFDRERDDGSPTYGTVDPTDPRRLSFISFADVVHAEHMESVQDVAHGAHDIAYGSSDPSAPSSMRSRDRSASVGQPTSLNAEPPAVRGGSLSAPSGHGMTHGDLTIETMRQTLKKTGSNEQTHTTGQPSASVYAHEHQSLA